MTDETTVTTPEAGAEAAPAQDPGSWASEITDEAVRNFVGEKTPLQIAQEAYSHRQAASRREEQIREALIKDGGFLARPKEGEELSFFQQFAPEDLTAYAEVDPETFGEGASAYSRDFMAAAKDAGMSRAQFEALVTKLRDGDSARAESAGQETQALLKAQWGAEYDAKSELVNRAAKALFEDGGDAFLKALTLGASPENQAKALEQLAQIGVAIGDGLPSSPSGSAGTMTEEDERQALIAEAIERGGSQNLPPERAKRYNQIIYGVQ